MRSVKILLLLNLVLVSCNENHIYFLDFNYSNLSGLHPIRIRQKACISYSKLDSVLRLNYYFDNSSYSELYNKVGNEYVKKVSRVGGEISENAMTIIDRASRNGLVKEIYWHDTPDTSSNMYLMELHQYYNDSIVQYDFLQNYLYKGNIEHSMNFNCILYKTLMTYRYNGDTLVQEYRRQFTNRGKEYFKGSRILKDGAKWVEKSKCKYPYKTWFRYFPESILEKY